MYRGTAETTGSKDHRTATDNVLIVLLFVHIKISGRLKMMQNVQSAGFKVSIVTNY